MLPVSSHLCCSPERGFTRAGNEALVRYSTARPARLSQNKIIALTHSRQRGASFFASAGRGEHAAVGEVTEEHFDKIVGLNVRGTLFTVQKALPLFNDGGSIILNGSIASTKGFPSPASSCVSTVVLHKSSGANLGTEKDITKLAGKVAIVTGTSKKTFLKIDALRPVYSSTKRANVCAR